MWSGRSGAATVGPNGAAALETQLAFPLHTGHDPVNAQQAALLARAGTWRFVASSTGRQRYLGDELPLLVRVNDDTPGDGSGAFRIRVRVFRAPEQ